MGARFTAASTQYLANSSPRVTALPFIFGCWVYTVDIGTNYIQLCLTSSVANNNLLNLNITALPAFTFNSNAGGTVRTATSAITPVAGQWYWIAGRAVSSTSRWIIVYDPSTGRVDQVRNITSSVPTLTTPRLGIGGGGGSSAQLSSNDIIAEYFVTNSDVPGNATGTALATEFVRKLALEGPFSCPEIVDDIVEYRSLLSGMDNPIQSDSVSTGLVYSRVGLTTWANPFTAANVPTAGLHPPLSPNYIRPGQVKPIFVV